MVKSKDTAHGSNVEKSLKYQLLATYFNIRIHPESFTKECGMLSHPELLLVTKITPVRLRTRNKSHRVKETKNCALPHLCAASKQRRMQNQCGMCIYRQNTTIFISSITGYLACGPYGGRERSVQGAGGETRGEETAGETKA